MSDSIFARMMEFRPVPMFVRMLELYADPNGLSASDLTTLKKEYALSLGQAAVLGNAAMDGEFSARELKTLEQTFGKPRAQMEFRLFYERPNRLNEWWHERMAERVMGHRAEGADYSLFTYLGYLRAPEDIVVQGMTFLKGTELHFYPDCHIMDAYLKSDTTIAGRVYPKGAILSFDAEHRPSRIIAQEAGEYAGISLEPGDILNLDSKGKVTSKEHDWLFAVP